MEIIGEKRLYWPKPKIFKFIRLVRKHPQLWDPNHKDYHNSYQRELAYDQISFELGITNAIVRKKIHTLRSQHRGEIRKMKKNRIETVWPYFNATKFFFDPHAADDDTGDDESTNADDEYIQSSKFDETVNEEEHKWRQSRVLKLIESCQKYPELYTANCFDYRNKYKRSIAFQKVAEEMNTTVGIVKEKMHNLRTNYISELKKLKNGTKKSKWALFDVLKSLYEGEDFKATSSEFVKIEVDEDNYVEAEYDEAEFLDTIESNTKAVSDDDDRCHENNVHDGEPTAKRLRLSTKTISTTSSVRWKESKTFKLIELYKKYPELYDNKCLEYRSQLKRKLAYNALAKQLNTTPVEIRNKLHTLRTCYVKELNKMKMNNTEETKWAYFEALKELYNDLKVKPRTKYSAADLSMLGINEEEIDIYIDDKSESEQLSLDETDHLITPEILAPTNGNCVAVCKPSDEFAIFGETIATELRLTREHADIHKHLKRQIVKALSEAKAKIAKL